MKCIPPFPLFFSPDCPDMLPDEVNPRIWVINQGTVVVQLITTHTHQLSAESDWSQVKTEEP